MLFSLKLLFLQLTLQFIVNFRSPILRLQLLLILFTINTYLFPFVSKFLLQVKFSLVKYHFIRIMSES